MAMLLGGSDRLAHGSPQQPRPPWGRSPRNAPARALLHGGWDGPSWPAHARLSFLPPGARLLGASVV